MATLDVACIRVAIEGRIADILLDHKEGLHVSEICTKAGLEETKLARILRCLATRNVFREGAYSSLIRIQSKAEK